jgi:hypothetical protein
VADGALVSYCVLAHTVMVLQWSCPSVFCHLVTPLQLAQRLAPDEAAYLPARQFEHEPVPTSGLNWPAPQLSHVPEYLKKHVVCDAPAAQL